MQFLLMNKDTPWLLFECHEDEFGYTAGAELAWYTPLRPIGYDNIADYLDSRTASTLPRCWSATTAPPSKAFFASRTRCP